MELRNLRHTCEVCGELQKKVYDDKTGRVMGYPERVGWCGYCDLWTPAWIEDGVIIQGNARWAAAKKLAEIEAAQQNSTHDRLTS